MLPPGGGCPAPPDGAAALDGLPGGVRERVEQYLDEAGDRDRLRALVALTPDASDRRYIRVERQDAPSYVLAVHAGPIDVARLPFVNVQTLLAGMPLPVPAILGHSNPLGILALQDLGDVTLQAHLSEASPAERARLYERAVDLLDTLQRRGATLASPAYLPYGLAFDVEKLTWELDFFVAHFLDAHRGIVLASSERAGLDAAFLSLASELASEPRVLCHRDYHSRNLMVHDGALYLIDFQDARLGPDTYDLASLLRDAYVDFAEEEVDRLVAYFVARRARDLDPDARDAYAHAFRPRFDAMCVQRNLKALGTFGFQAASKQNPAYLRDVPRTLAHVRRNLLRHPRFEPLRSVLAAHLPELR